MVPSWWESGLSPLLPFYTQNPRKLRTCFPQRSGDLESGATQCNYNSVNEYQPCPTSDPMRVREATAREQCGMILPMTILQTV